MLVISGGDKEEGTPRASAAGGGVGVGADQDEEGRQENRVG